MFISKRSIASTSLEAFETVSAGISILQSARLSSKRCRFGVIAVEVETILQICRENLLLSHKNANPNFVVLSHNGGHLTNK